MLAATLSLIQVVCRRRPIDTISPPFATLMCRLWTDGNYVGLLTLRISVSFDLMSNPVISFLLRILGYMGHCLGAGFAGL